MSIQSDGLPDWEPIVEETIPLKNEDFLGPDIEEFFPENPCLLEIGRQSLDKLIRGNMKELVIGTIITEEQLRNHATTLAARTDVANNFMKYFNINVVE